MFRGVLTEKMGLEWGVKVRFQLTEHFMASFSVLEIPLPLFLEMLLG